MDPLKCRVKAAAVANLTDARYFAALGVDYLGFALEPGMTGHIGPMEVAAFREWIEGPELVGEFGGMEPTAIAKLCDELELHVAQVGPFGKTQEVAAATGREVLQEIVLGEEINPTQAQVIVDTNASHVRGFILDFARNGYSWDQLANEPTWMEWLVEVCTDYPVLLDIPAAAQQVEEILTTLNPVGVQLRGGEEEAVGVKSFDDLDDWFEVLRIEE